MREDLNPWFQPLFELPDPKDHGPLDWSSVFANAGPVELDVGSGRGRFTNEGAAARPDVNLCGIEHDFTAARRGAKRLKRDQSPNARVFGGDAVRFLRVFVPPGSLSAVHVLYPDPWWKRRHRKRRLLGEAVGPGFLDLILAALAPDGRLHVRTDVGEYFGGITALLDAHPRLARRADPLGRNRRRDRRPRWRRPADELRAEGRRRSGPAGLSHRRHGAHGSVGRDEGC